MTANMGPTHSSQPLTPTADTMRTSHDPSVDGSDVFKTAATSDHFSLPTPISNSNTGVSSVGHANPVYPTSADHGFADVSHGISVPSTVLHNANRVVPNFRGPATYDSNASSTYPVPIGEL